MESRHAAEAAGVMLARGLFLATVLWYLSVQMQWFQERGGLSRPRALGLAVWLWLVATLIAVMVGTVLIN